MIDSYRLINVHGFTILAVYKL